MGVPPVSTYRLQVRPGFDLHAAADVCDYLGALGVGALYLSPLLPSARGSDHGYDVVGFDTVDAARGGTDGWTRLLASARSRGLGVVVDIVPNHAGVATPAENAAWWDLLRLGRDSEYARWFDVDWSSGRIRLPVLGDDYEPTQLSVDGDGDSGQLAYFEHRFPIAPGTGPSDGESAADVHDRQNYRLVSFRSADTDQNYRRFFAVTTLAGLRVEDPVVFAATHAQIDRWMREDGVAGLRVDHPDGLADPGGYLHRLRELAGRSAWITVEKILEPGEALPDWPVDGTTGYDALAEVSGLFVDPAAEVSLDATYRALTGDDLSYSEHVTAGKRGVVETILRAEVNRLARLAPSVERADEALAELLVAFPVYRSYPPPPATPPSAGGPPLPPATPPSAGSPPLVGAEHLAAAISAVTSQRPELAEAVARLMPRLSDPADELCVRFQQTSGAVMAKGVEDTAYYRYTRFVALNEVGGDPARFGVTPLQFHARQAERAERQPRSMTTLSTHDTKRGEDVRARLAVLSELPGEWHALADRLMRTVRLPDRTFGYLLWQTFVGAGFVARDRMHAYAEKAMREAGGSTGWIDPDAAFEGAVHDAVDRAYDDPEVHAPLAELADRITPFGWSNSLGQKLVQLCMPGVPDVYQGTELWEDSLVDPDNRRPVDFDAARTLLDRIDGEVHAPAPLIDESGAAKLWVVSRALRLRRELPELFVGYRPVPVQGPASEHVIAFERHGVIALATRLPVGLHRAGGWRDTTVQLGAGWQSDGEFAGTDVISGRRHSERVAVADLLADYPVALLVR